MRLTKQSETTIEGNGRGEQSHLRRWFAVYGMNLAVLPYFAAMWASSSHVGVMATPWAIGWIILWLIFSPLASWSGLHVMARAYRLTVASLVALVVAAPFLPDALTTVVTLIAISVLGAVYWTWIPIAAFVAIVAGIWIWYHGEIGL